MELEILFQNAQELPEQMFLFENVAQRFNKLEMMANEKNSFYSCLMKKFQLLHAKKILLKDILKSSSLTGFIKMKTSKNVKDSRIQYEVSYIN